MFLLVWPMDSRWIISPFETIDRAADDRTASLGSPLRLLINGEVVGAA
jgi:hypothetical protein